MIGPAVARRLNAARVDAAHLMRSNVGKFRTDTAERLSLGEHLVVYGPRGSGKSTLLRELEAHFEHRRIPCGRACCTSSLDDITQALMRTYSEVDTTGIPRRQARARLRLAAESSRGVLLLDQVTAVSTQMVGFLRRLRGGVVGVLCAVDVDVERDFRTMRGWHLGTSSVRMPPASNARVRRLFRARCQPEVEAKITALHEREIVRAARGRLGWIVQCRRLIEQARYWNVETLYVSVLCTDTEIALRQGDLGLLLPPDVENPARAE